MKPIALHDRVRLRTWKDGEPIVTRDSFRVIAVYEGRANSPEDRWSVEAGRRLYTMAGGYAGKPRSFDELDNTVIPADLPRRLWKTWRSPEYRKLYPEG